MRSIIALALSVLAIAGVVLYASELQRKVADENYHEAIVARELGADMLARENALSDYIESGRADELVLLYQADRRLDANLEHAKELSSDSPEELGTLEPQVAAEDSWDAVAKIAIDAKQADDSPPGSKKSAYREGLVDNFVRANREYQRLLDEARVEELKAAALVPVKLILLVSVLLGAISCSPSACAGATCSTRTSRSRRRPTTRSAATRRARPASARRCRSPRTRPRATTS